jgi:cyclopropane-fatty-acyl-phospholipid synthase
MEGTGYIDRVLLGLICPRAGQFRRGRLDLTLPGGAATTLGGAAPGPSAKLSILRNRVFWRLLSRGKLGFAESYLDGDVSSDDLDALFAFMLANDEAIRGGTPSLLRPSRSDRRYHASRENSRAGSRRNIAAHYDLGNAFYRHWLDEGMTYSSGIFADTGDTLDQAQAAKYEAILKALEVREAQSLLEIGCGWGGLLEAAAKRGIRATGITISKEQLAWTQTRLQAGRLDSLASARFQDYRDTSGTWDRVASIEMVEAVGEAYWQGYFDVIASRLKPGGVAVIQAITIAEQHFEEYRRTPDFIQRYIFPGGMLPTSSAMARCAMASGLSFEPVLLFGSCYARTLREWRARFNGAWPQIRELGFDERFRRMWDYYLAYCAAGFDRRAIDVGLYRFRKP